MDLYDIFARAESVHVRKLLEHARGLTDAQLDKPLDNTCQRLIALDVLRDLGVKVEGFGCPTEYEASVVRAR